ncbi:DUF1552 domain-containing protein [Candidatus Rariloculus sp.]|uniref:DUF1552 domain-containing protein n=1 Tax=Candidatus Rariloculus sp. TaxID=3101265 RepID=UPI003D09F052
MPHGAYPAMWHPDQTGSDFEFKPIMKPLEPYRDHLVTISQMKAPDGSVHLGASAQWLNGVGPVGEAGDYARIESKKTVDQYIADVVAEDTPLRSLEVGTEDMGTAAGACDGFPCVFFNTISWRDDTSPLPVGINPQVTFERMFGDPGTPSQRLERLRQKQSMLDSVAHETKRLQRTLGAADNVLLDQYLTNVRRVEMQLQKMDARADTIVEAPDAPVGVPDQFDDHLTVTYDLMHLAFQGDLSRVFTFMLGHEASSRSYAHIGISEPHHPVSHHADKPEGIEKYSKIVTYQIAKLGEFVDKLGSTPDGDGTLLDSAVVYWGSGMSNANVHDRHNAPAILLGGGNGHLQGNRHIAAKEKEPTGNLLLALADMAGAECESFGESTGRLAI